MPECFWFLNQCQYTHCEPVISRLPLPRNQHLNCMETLLEAEKSIDSSCFPSNGFIAREPQGTVGHERGESSEGDHSSYADSYFKSLTNVGTCTYDLGT